MSPLEWEADRQNTVVVVRMEVSRGDLDSPTDGERQSLPKMESSDDQAGGYENLSLPIVRAVLEMLIVQFYFRPELSIKVILKRIVPGNCAANLDLVARRQGHAERALNVECSEALPVGDSRGDDSVGRSILVLARGQSGLEERR